MTVCPHCLIPSELLSMGAVAERAGISITGLCYHVKNGLLTPIEMIMSGRRYRVFAAADVDRFIAAREASRNDPERTARARRAAHARWDNV